MNVKKMFASLTGVLMLATTVSPLVTGAASYSEELQGAYDYAYKTGITTMSSIDNANMYGELTRGQLSKMISNWAEAELGTKVDETAACSFSDADQAEGDLATYVKKACQMGLMGQGIEKFRPNDKVTRGEFGTTLSRALWGDKYDGANPYYANHLEALKEAGIMTKIDNPNQMEVRGWVMLMLERSVEAATPSECKDPAVILACALDAEGSACPEACRNVKADEEEDNTPVVVKSGDLVVKANANNGGAVLGLGGTSDMDTLTLNTSENVEITKVVLERYGYSVNDDVKWLWLEDENGTIISNEVDSLNSKGQATLTLKKDYRNVDGTLNATIVLRTAKDDSATGWYAGTKAGKTIGLKVVDVTSTAKNVDLGDYTPYTYSVVEYSGADVTLTARGTTKTYNWEAGESYEVAKFKIKAPSDSAIEVRSFTLTDYKNNAIEYDDYLEDVTVTVAGEKVDSSWSVNKDDELVVNLEDVELAAKDNSEFVVTIKLADGFDNMGKAVQFYIKESADISASDVKTNSRVTIKDTNGNAYSITGAPTGWPVYTFEGSKVRITSTKLGNVEASADSTDVVIAEWEITTHQTIKAAAGTLKIEVDNGSNAANVVKALRLEIAGDEYEGTAHKTAGMIDYFTFSSIDVDKSGKIRVLVDTVESYSPATATPSVTFSLKNVDSFNYEDSKTAADIAGSLNISKLTLTASKASLTNTISSNDVEFKKGENDTKEIFNGTYTAKKKDVYLNKFTVSTTSTWDTTNNPMTVYLYLGDDSAPVADAKLTCASTCEASDSFTNVLVKAEQSTAVRVEAEVNAKAVASAVKFTIKLEWEDENGNANSGVADKQSAKVSVVTMWTPEVETVKSKDTVLLRGSDEAIAEFLVKPSSSSSIDLESVQFVSTEACSNLKLYIDGSDEDLTTSNSSAPYTCKADGFVRATGTDGIVVKIEYDDEPLFSDSLRNAKISWIKLNSTSISNTYSKAYADATITINQSNQTSYTKYTIVGLDKYNGSTTVSDLRLFVGDDELATSLKEGSTISKDDTFRIDNLAKSERITKMMYTVTRWNDVQKVVVDYSDYPDYFQTNADDLRVYDNTKESDPAGTTNKTVRYIESPRSMPSIGWLPGKKLADFQEGVVIDNVKHVISGTLLKQVPQVNNAGVDTSYVVYLKFENLRAGISQIKVDGSWVALDSDLDATISVANNNQTLKIDEDGDNTADVEYTFDFVLWA